jgi:peptide/nickel transport system permease protein
MGGLTVSYVLRRLGLFLLTIWLGSTIIFLVPRLAPGDPVSAMVTRMMAQGAQIENSAAIIEAWRARFGLDDPLYIQYFKYLGNIIRFDLGYSLSSFPSKVEDLVGQSLGWTVGLLLIATLISFIGGNTVGALMAWRNTPKLAKQLLPLTLTFTSVPFFMLGILLLYIFSFGLGWFPVGGGYGRGVQQGLNWEFIRSVIHHGTLPAFAIVIASVGFWALGMRGMMITTDGEDYMILAAAKGLRPGRVFWRYAVRNAVLPQVTALALNIGAIAGGAIVVEYLFSYPGMGYLLYLGIVNNDYTLIQGIVVMTIAGTATAGLILDLLYPILDPRINYQRS